MNLDLEKLEEKADEIFNRYKHKTEAGEVSEPAHSSYLYDVDNLPGSAYLRDVFPQDKEKTYMYDSDNLAQYFPIARYLLY
ncbi:hypothetical protein EB796_010643 [Bugula neritina]|uniref:Uncharacterized protein n=1 Tax=Bugula neritina TaxID=10212 RepID=A0A7J7K0D7_BUGNE|nr:hypothetical protein EB796_010643 [Bugula neritina]